MSLARSDPLRVSSRGFFLKEYRRLPNDRRDPPVVMMCSWCQQIHYTPIGGKTWFEADADCAAGGPSDARLGKGICDPCLETVSDQTLRLKILARAQYRLD